MPPTEYILLAHAHVNQTTIKGEKTDWSVEANKTNKQLAVLPKSLTDAEVFSILDFARKYELEAFNTGIVFGKEKQLKTDEDRITDLETKLRLAGAENERLAEALDIITNTKK